MGYSAAILLSLCILVAVHCININPHTNDFVDERGRVVVFRGFNAVNKLKPFIPVTDHFDAEMSLSAADIPILRSLGTNAIRLGVMWPAVETAPFKADHTYLSKISQLIGDLGDAGIGVIVDLHQDLLSERFCGEGAPQWLIPSHFDHEWLFPKPIKGWTAYTLDGQGNPSRTDCAKAPFFEYYMTEAVGKAFDALYANTPLHPSTEKPLDHLEFFWTTVAGALKQHDNIIAFELLNEPWTGDAIGHPTQLARPGHVEKTKLDPVYRRLSSAVRAAAPGHKVMFEPLVSSWWWYGASTPGPATEHIFSYHLYCPAGGKYHNSTFDKAECKTFDKSMLGKRLTDVKKMGTAGFLTEYGALTDPDQYDELYRVGDMIEEHRLSATYWAYKGFGDITTQAGASAGTEGVFKKHSNELDSAKVRAIVRPYAARTPGPIKVMKWDAAAKTFRLTFTAESTAPVEIYTADKWFFESGYTLRMMPPAWGSVADAGNGWIKVTPSKTGQFTLILQ